MRRPSDLQFAECGHVNAYIMTECDGHDCTIETDIPCQITTREAEQLARWLTKAAAWIKEQEKKR